MWTSMINDMWWQQEEDLHLENVYYSEMKDAGFFDADWEWYGKTSEGWL